MSAAGSGLFERLVSSLSESEIGAVEALLAKRRKEFAQIRQKEYSDRVAAEKKALPKEKTELKIGGVDYFPRIVTEWNHLGYNSVGRIVEYIKTKVLENAAFK